MEIESIEIKAHGGKIIIPEGYKAVVKDGIVTVEKEEKVQDFKDGDVLTSRFDNKVVFIFKEDESKQKDNKNGYYVCHTADYVIDVSTKDSLLFCGYKKDVRLATEEEKQLLFAKMKEQGLKWNAEEKRVEKIRWEAKDGEKYHYVFSTIEVNDTTHCNRLADRLRVGNGNCFRTEEQAEEAARRVKETLRKFHEEIGE